MRKDRTMLQQAISFVDQERSYLPEERRAYEAFREQVRLATPDPTDAIGPLETTEQLLAAYRDEVMDTLDHDTVYGDTLAESLEAELSPALVQVFLSKNPLTQRRKRNLLVETTGTIKRREEFCAELNDEWATLEMFAQELADVEEPLEKLPACSAREQPLEKLLVIWEVYDTLLERCERLLERRQQQIRAAKRSVRIFGKKHIRNEFLYIELDIQYPILSAIAATCERIASKRNGEEPPESPDGTLQY